MATAIASSHIRMRPQWPMLTMSDTAPMTQKLLLLPTAPKMKASTKPPQMTIVAMLPASAFIAVSSRCRRRWRQGPVTPARRPIVAWIASGARTMPMNWPMPSAGHDRAIR